MLSVEEHDVHAVVGGPGVPVVVLRVEFVFKGEKTVPVNETVIKIKLKLKMINMDSVSFLDCDHAPWDRARLV